MKAKKIYSACKESKQIHVVTTQDGRQFVETTNGWFLIDGMPRMQEAEFYAYLEVPKSDREKWNVTEKETDDDLFADLNENDITLAPHPVSIVCGGRHLTAFITEDGAVLWLDNEAFSPMVNAEWRFTMRCSDDGESYIAVTEGLYLMAALRYEMSPEVMPGEGLADRLLQLAGVKTSAENE